jgi:hypothetical protein
MTNGGFVVVDECDVEFALSRNWYSVKSRGTKYAKTGKNERMHRLLLGVIDATKIVDHINGDGLDNRRSNLRVVDVSLNVANRQRSRSGNRCPGVWKRDGKWIARVTVEYKNYRLGIFEDELDAIAAVNAFRKQIGRPEVRIND